ncbi:MAG TPA: hypothetical protein VM580_00655 [Labilithrix sp.]|nr:hypothetical protein [Labilithrix sp.]
MSPVDALNNSISQHAGAIHRSASSSPAGGGPEWDSLMRHYGLAPLDPTERAMIVQAMRLSRGAVPAEVRIAFVGLRVWAQRELDRLRADPAATSLPTFAWTEQRVRDLVERETAAYELSIGIPPAASPPPASPAAPVAPAAPSLASIFANAQETSKEVPWAGMTYKTTTNLNCVHCGGPQEQPADFMCKYCRRPIAGTIKPTA